ncbi:MAG: hypothetical protein ACLR06_14690 [Christensenellaceae bacterium]
MTIEKENKTFLYRTVKWPTAVLAYKKRVSGMLILFGINKATTPPEPKARAAFFKIARFLPAEAEPPFGGAAKSPRE